MVFILIAVVIILFFLLRKTVLLKNGVNLHVSDEIFFALGVADSVYKRIADRQVVVTSARDGHQNKPNSLHNIGQAVDLRIRDLTNDQVQRIGATLHNSLFPQGFDVVVENDHIHVEYDPKPTLGRIFTGESVV